MKYRMTKLWLCSLILLSLFSVTVRAEWKMENRWVYVDEDGTRKKDEWYTDQAGKTYYIDEDGIMTIGWYQDDIGNYYFFDPSGEMVRGVKLIDDRYYYFTENGVLSDERVTLSGETCDFTKEGIANDDLPPMSVDTYTNGELTASKAEDTAYSGWNWTMILVMLAAGIGAAFFARKREDRREILFVAAAVFFASIPLFTRYLVYGHDITFHLNRVLGMEAALEAGMFPVRINGFTFWGYGYLDPVFYPQLFLYIPAVLHMMGVPFVTALQIWMFLMHAAAAIFMYACGKAIFRSAPAACASAVCYTLAVYRLSNLYTRAAFGEFTAMVFFPLAVWGLYELFYGDEKRWWLLPLAFTGIFQSHIISTVLTAAACVILGICSLKKLREKKRLAALGKVIGFTVLLNLWFLIPLLQYMGTEISTSGLEVQFETHAAALPVLLKIFSPATGSSSLVTKDLSGVLPLSPGLAILCGIPVFVSLYLGKGKKVDQRAQVFFWAGLAFFVASSTLIPWNLLVKLPMMRTVTSYIQFPWRLVGPAVCLLALACGWAYWEAWGQWDKKRKGVNVFFVGVFALAMVSSQYYLDGVAAQSAYLWDEDQVTPNIGKIEYLYEGTDAYQLTGIASPSHEQVKILDSGNDVLAAHCTYEITGPTEGEAYIDMPVLYFPGYQGMDEEGRLLPITRGENNVVRVYPQEAELTIQVYFKAWNLFRIMESLSLLSVIGFAGLVLLERRKKAI